MALKDLVDHRASFQFTDADLDTLKTLLPHLKSDKDRTVFLSGQNAGTAIGMESGDDGCCAIALPECRFDGAESMAVCVNGQLLVEALDHGFRHMKVKDGRTPLHFRDGDGGTHLLMPLRYDVSETLELEFAKVLDASAESDEEISRQPVNLKKEAGGGLSNKEIPEEISRGALNNKEEHGGNNKEVNTMSETTKTSENSGFTVIEGTDPVTALEEFADIARDAVKQADQAVRDLKKQVRTVKSHYRNREKDLNTREKDMQKSLTLLNKLQDSLAA